LSLAVADTGFDLKGGVDCGDAPPPMDLLVTGFVSCYATFSTKITLQHDRDWNQTLKYL